eukprot:SAG11_NODE_5312_length_1599_cov_4.756667_1_plen_111_part_00
MLLTAKAAAHPVLLTGTPALNCPMELFALVHAVRPDLFPKWKAFAQRYCAPRQIWRGGRFPATDYRGSDNLDELHALLTANCMIRRKKGEVLSQVRCSLPLPSPRPSRRL